MNPFSEKSKAASERLPSSERVPPEYPIAIIGRAISFAGRERMNPQRTFPSRPKIFATGLSTEAKISIGVIPPKEKYEHSQIIIPEGTATRTALRLLKDNMGRYLLQDDISSPFGTTLLGKPVFVSDNMPEIGAGNTVIYYGDLKGLATKFSEEINIQVLREKYADEHADGVIGWFEFDAKVMDAQMLAKLVMASA